MLGDSEFLADTGFIFVLQRRARVERGFWLSFIFVLIFGYCRLMILISSHSNFGISSFPRDLFVTARLSNLLLNRFPSICLKIILKIIYF